MTTFKAEERIQGVCPLCEWEGTIKKGVRSETLVVRGEPIELEAKVRRCDLCGEFFATVEEEERNFQKAFRAFRERHKLLQPEEIRAIRAQYGLGQRAFSRLLGWGEITLHRYEAGALQDEIHNNELLLLRDPKNFEVLFDRNKEELSQGLRRRVEERLGDLVSKTGKAQLRRLLESLFGEARDDILSGYRQFDLDRFENVTLYLCKHVPKVTKTKLNKLLWYCDFLSFKAHRRSITGLMYVHLPYGPVPNHYDYCVAHLLEEGALSSREFVFKGVIGEAYRACDEPDLSLFSRNEINVLEKVAYTFRRMRAKEITERSHTEEGYRRTGPGKIVSYSWADALQLDL